VHIAWGIVIVVLGLLAWAGQLVSWLAPATAVRLSLMEAEADVEPVFWADIRGEARWDAVTLWTMPVAGVLLIADRPSWAYFGLVGGGMFLYFAGRGISARLAMQRRGFRIGAASSVTLGYTVLGVWAVMALVTIVAAVRALPVP
jgi:hypothetical protein